MGQDVAGPRCRQLLERPRVLLPAVVDLAGRPLVHLQRDVDVVEAPGAQPVHRAQQHVEGVAGQQRRHLVHPARVVVDLQADDDGKAGILGLLGAAHVRHRGRPWRGNPSTRPSTPASAAGTRSSAQNPPSRASAWRKRNRCSVTRQFLHPGRLGLLAVGRQLVEVAGASHARRAATGGGGSRARRDPVRLSRRGGSASRRLEWWSARRPPGGR